MHLKILKKTWTIWNFQTHFRNSAKVYFFGFKRCDIQNAWNWKKWLAEQRIKKEKHAFTLVHKIQTNYWWADMNSTWNKTDSWVPKWNSEVLCVVLLFITYAAVQCTVGTWYEEEEEDHTITTHANGHDIWENQFNLNFLLNEKISSQHKSNQFSNSIALMLFELVSRTKEKDIRHM